MVDVSAPSASSEAVSTRWLELANKHARRNAGAEPGSADALYEAQASIFYLMQHLGGVGSYVTAAANLTERETWIATLSFLAGTQSFPSLPNLSIALQELNRGVVADALKPKSGGRRGGVSDTSELQLMSYAVEAADELRRHCVGVEDYHAELAACGCPHRTLDGYRNKVASGPPEVQPRSSYIIAWFDVPPAELLKRTIQELAQKRAQR